ncbi:MAG: prephenate dehydrogenase/arogenate dehydrogenase family protein [Deltaproteobacteria bacterium]|nr:prephenate dehydrogenase/arogenate dehydrogenase family protein [Deltaproteobacteria bacterium]MBW2596056.1 prephenate dehydrogenase/arogenate dehydrogenase family protein [Deltaproteobacteria bacterium]
MKNIQIGIIGGTGGIGRWFANFFKKEGYTVHVSGRRTGMDMDEMAERCRVVIVSVPIGATVQVIKQLGPGMKKESLFMDLTSLKTEPVTAMLKSSISEVIGLHPLFGPNIRSMSGKNVAVCPVRTEKWFPWLTEILKRRGANLIETTPEGHDEAMAIVQGLTHLNTITMGLVLGNAGKGLSELKDFSTPIFDEKINIIKKVFAGNPGLYAEIIAFNPHIHKILDLYSKNLSELKSLIDRTDTKGLTELMENRFRNF